jgi:hypothetical protein
MRVRRGLLFWGLLLIPLGGIPLLDQAGVIDVSRFADAWRLWPLVLVGIGIALLLGRTRVALVGTAVIALTLGAIGGVALAAPDNWFGSFGDCTAGNATHDLRDTGTFSSPAEVSLDFRCGTIEVSAGQDADWVVDAAYGRTEPSIESDVDRLSVRAARGSAGQHDEWRIALPASQLARLELTANAASGEIDLGDATLERLSSDINAGDMQILAGTGGTDDIDLSMNAGRLRLETGRAAMSGSISINAGAIDLCVPADVGLRLDVTDQLTFATNLGSQGLARSGDVWTRPAASGAPTIDLAIDGNAASLMLKPEGACR